MDDCVVMTLFSCNIQARPLDRVTIGIVLQVDSTKGWHE